MFGLLNALLGKERNAQQQMAAGLPGQGVSPIDPVQAAPAPITGDPEEIAVSGSSPFGTLKRGLVQTGPFSMGQTGGNILGLIGDALLVQSGNQKQYDPRLQQARAAEALASYTDDPMDAIRRLNEIDPAAAAELADKYRAHQLDTSKADVEAMGEMD